jgi:hypothetical protein
MQSVAGTAVLRALKFTPNVIRYGIQHRTGHNLFKPAEERAALEVAERAYFFGPIIGTGRNRTQLLQKSKLNA